jgi:sulfate transport system permease protein
VIDSVFGFIIAWVLVRYRFPGKRLLDAVIDLPFALPTAVAGIALSTLYAPNGWIGSLLISYGIKIAYTPLGCVGGDDFYRIAFHGADRAAGAERAGVGNRGSRRHLGRDRLQTIARVVLPMLAPAILTGAAMAFARGAGEYGSIISSPAIFPRSARSRPC